MGSPWQEYWSGLPFPPLGDLPNPGIKPTSPASAGGFFTTSVTWEAWILYYNLSLILWASLVAPMVKRLSAMQETLV